MQENLPSDIEIISGDNLLLLIILDSSALTFRNYRSHFGRLFGSGVIEKINEYEKDYCNPVAGFMY